MRFNVKVNLHMNVAVSNLSEALVAANMVTFVRLELQVNRIDVEPQVLGSLENRLALVAFVLAN